MDVFFTLLVVGGLIWWWRTRSRKPENIRPVEKPDLSMLPEQFIVYDLETTGLNSGTHEIIEIGAIKANRDSDMHATFETLIIPTGRISAKITQITGLDRTKLKSEGIPLKQALEEFASFVGDLPMVAYNEQFDQSFLKHSFERSNLPPMNNKSHCVLKMARKAWPGRTSYKLSSLASDGNLSLDSEHRALADCRRTLIVFVAAAQTLRNKL